MNIERRLLRLLVVILATLLLVIGILSGAPGQAGAQGQWPGQVLLWRGTTPVTQTIQYQAVDVVGANYAYLFYNTGFGSATGTVNITVTRQWRGVTFQTLTTSGSVSATLAATGAVTVASASPYYPSAQIAISVNTGTITPTIAVVGQ
jgi:hypothetical protein